MLWMCAFSENQPGGAKVFDSPVKTSIPFSDIVPSFSVFSMELLHTYPVE
jgi:hypothetical protein